MATWIGAKEVAFLLAQARARRKIFYDPVDGADLRSSVQAASIGTARLVGDVYGPYEVIAKRPDGSWDIGGSDQAVAAAATAGGQLAGISYVCVAFTDHPCATRAFWGGAGGRCYVDMLVPLGVLAMENLQVLKQFPDLYGIPDRPGGFNVMDCCCGTHPSAFTKLSFGWIDPGTVATVSAGCGTANLPLQAVSQPLSSAPTPGRVHAVKVPAATGSGYHLIEARLRTDRYETTTPNVSNGIPSQGVDVYWIDESAWPPVHLRSMLSTTGGTYADAARGLQVTPSAAVPSGFTVAVNRTPPAECTAIRDELASVVAEIRDLQVELRQAAPGEGCPRRSDQEVASPRFETAGTCRASRLPAVTRRPSPPCSAAVRPHRSVAARGCVPRPDPGQPSLREQLVTSRFDAGARIPARPGVADPCLRTPAVHTTQLLEEACHVSTRPPQHRPSQ